jgi:hypothetical protein
MFEFDIDYLRKLIASSLSENEDFKIKYSIYSSNLLKLIISDGLTVSLVDRTKKSLINEYFNITQEDGVQLTCIKKILEPGELGHHSGWLGPNTLT